MIEELSAELEATPVMTVTVDPNFATVPHVSRSLPETSITWGECAIHWESADIAGHIEHAPTGCTHVIDGSLSTEEERHRALMALDSVVCESFTKAGENWVRCDA